MSRVITGHDTVPTVIPGHDTVPTVIPGHDTVSTVIPGHDTVFPVIPGHDNNLAPPACQVPGDGQGQGHVTESLHQQHTRTLGGQESGKYIS